MEKYERLEEPKVPRFEDINLDLDMNMNPDLEKNKVEIKQETPRIKKEYLLCGCVTSLLLFVCGTALLILVKY
jgi:hypothetical protein